MDEIPLKFVPHGFRLRYESKKHGLKVESYGCVCMTEMLRLLWILLS